MTEHTDSQALVERARAQMAEKARLPWWYVAAIGLGMLALLLQAPISHLTPSAAVYAGLGWPIGIVLLVGPPLLRRLRGVDVGRAPLARYPSTRMLGIGFFVVAAAGIIAVQLLAGAELIVPAIVVAVVLSASVVVYQLRENVAVRRDILAGRARP